MIGPQGKSVEVQIRTHEMHRGSELGVAAHWRYKEGGGRQKSEKDYGEKIAWLRQVLDWKDEVKETGDVADSQLTQHFRTGLFDDTIYVFTPQGKVVDLPHPEGPTNTRNSPSITSRSTPRMTSTAP